MSGQVRPWISSEKLEGPQDQSSPNAPKDGDEIQNASLDRHVDLRI